MPNTETARLEAALAHAVKCSHTAPTQKGRVWWLLQAADFAKRIAALG